MGNGHDKLLEKLNEIAIDFEIGFFEKVVQRDPDDVESLMILGNNYTLRGDYRRGLEIDLRLSAVRPRDPIVQYNLACSYSLLGNPDEAVASLEAAIALGYRDFEFMRKDRDLDPIRKDARFQRLVESLARV